MNKYIHATIGASLWALAACGRISENPADTVKPPQPAPAATLVDSAAPGAQLGCEYIAYGGKPAFCKLYDPDNGLMGERCLGPDGCNFGNCILRNGVKELAISTTYACPPDRDW